VDRYGFLHYWRFVPETADDESYSGRKADRQVWSNMAPNIIDSIISNI
jgi:hypothetical protein